MKAKRIISAALVGVMAVACLAGCGSKAEKKEDKKATIKVGSKAFSENIIVAELYSLALEDAGYTVDRAFSLSDQVPHESITSGKIDMYPEYTGTGLINQLQMDISYDKDDVYQKVKDGYKEKWNIDWLESSDINDTNCYIMRKDVAEELGIKSMADAQAKSDQLIFGYVGNTMERGDYKHVEETYGKFNYKDTVQIEDQLKYTAMEKGDINFAMALSTDPTLANGEYIVLEEDPPINPPYYLTPIIRDEVLKANPDIEDILNGISEKLDNDTIIELVDRVDNQHEEAEDVALDFFESECK